MIIESGRVVAITQDCLWVETIQKSTCNSCVAKQGCGQSLLAKWGGHTSYLRVLLNGRGADSFHVNDTVEIGIPEDVIVKGSLFVYLIPLLSLLTGAWIGHSWFDSEAVTIGAAVIGLILGGGVVKWRAVQTYHDPHLQPTLIDPHTRDLTLME